MDILHSWPILVLALATGACILILLWILVNFLREAHPPKDTSEPLGGPRTPRR